MGFSRQDYLSGLPCPPPGDLPDARIKPAPMSPAMTDGFFTTRTTWEALEDDTCLEEYSSIWKEHYKKGKDYPKFYPSMVATINILVNSLADNFVFTVFTDIIHAHIYTYTILYKWYHTYMCVYTHRHIYTYDFFRNGFPHLCKKCHIISLN